VVPLIAVEKRFPNRHGKRIHVRSLAQRLLTLGYVAATSLLAPGCVSGASSVGTSAASVSVSVSPTQFEYPITSRLEVRSERCYRLLEAASDAVLTEQCIGGSAAIDDLPVNELYSAGLLKVAIIGRGWTLLDVSPDGVRVEQQGQWILFEGQDAETSTVTLRSADSTLECIFSVPTRCKRL
jgi:hypothetical protein